MRDDIEQILINEALDLELQDSASCGASDKDKKSTAITKKKKKKFKKSKNFKRTLKELVKNMQEMLMIGAGIHSKMFKSAPTQLKMIISD